MGLREDLIAAAVYAPSLTGGTLPFPWMNGAQWFNGTTDRIIAPSGVTLGLGNLTWVSVCAVPDETDGENCVWEFSGLTNGVTLWLINGVYWASLHRGDSTIATVSSGGAAEVGVPAFLFVQVTPTGLSLYHNAVLAGTQAVAINTTNATDSGGVGAVYSDSRLPGGGAVDNAPTVSSKHFAGTLADLYAGITDEGLAGAIAMSTAPIITRGSRLTSSRLQSSRVTAG